METLVFDIDGIRCGGFFEGVQHTLCALDGVSDVGASRTPGRGTLHADASCVSASQIHAAVTQLGYSATERSREDAERRV
jgi:copper chaperone